MAPHVTLCFHQSLILSLHLIFHVRVRAYVYVSTKALFSHFILLFHVRVRAYVYVSTKALFSHFISLFHVRVRAYVYVSTKALFSLFILFSMYVCVRMFMFPPKPYSLSSSYFPCTCACVCLCFQQSPILSALHYQPINRILELRNSTITQTVPKYKSVKLQIRINIKTLILKNHSGTIVQLI